MDGATCLKADDGSVVIRRQTVRNWIVLVVILGVGLPITVGLLWATISGIVKGESDLVGALEALAVVVGSGSIIGAGVYNLVRSMRRSTVHINAKAKMLEIGHGSSLRQISFSSVLGVIVESIERGSVDRHEIGVYRIGVVLGDGNRLPLGTVSGEVAKTKERAESIAQLIADVTGVSRGQEGD